MKLTKLIKQSFFQATALVAYVFMVVELMTSAQTWFGKDDKPLTGVAVLLLFVFSAAVTGTLFLGKPLTLYLDGAKKDAVKMLVGNIIWLFIWLMIFFSLIRFAR